MKPIVKQGLKREKKNNRAAVWRLEVDYELTTFESYGKKGWKAEIQLSSVNWND